MLEKPHLPITRFLVSVATLGTSAAHSQTLPPPASGDQAQPVPTPRIVAPRPNNPHGLPAPVTGDSTARSESNDTQIIIISPDVPAYNVPPRQRPATKQVPSKTPAKVNTPAKTQRVVVKVGGIDVSNGSEAAAVAKVRNALSPTLQTPIRLSDGAKVFSLSRERLGATIPYAALVRTARARQAMRHSVDVPLRFSVDQQKTQAVLRSLSHEVKQSATPAKLDVADNGDVQFRGSDSVELAVSGSAQRIKQILESNPTTTRIDLVVKRVPHDGKSGTSQSTLGQFRYVLASFSTPYDARIRGRTTNLRMAATLVNGTIVPAGGVFSANKAIGPRTAAAGWREAKMFVSGQVVNGIGSGICQGSTTIYNAALLAGLPIIERHPHSFRVMYAPASRDAAIYWGQKDMRFRNTTSGPIYVQTFLSGGRFHARLYGTQPAPANVRVESRVISRAKGTRSEAYRIRQTSSGVVRERLSRDFYKPLPN
jgi:vancomycin resistance protein YoaR